MCGAYFGGEPGSACDAEGWFATGDVATIDPDGYMEITDRSKDVIKSGGEWISSIMLENLAVSHPDVAEAAIVAVTHPKWDERPLLLVVPMAGRVTLDRGLGDGGLRGAGAEMVAAGRRGGGGRTAAHGDGGSCTKWCCGSGIGTIWWGWVDCSARGLLAGLAAETAVFA